MDVKIYTDGACSGNPGPGGWAAVFQKPNKFDAISGYRDNTTNNQMELFAVLSAMKKILNEHDIISCFQKDIEYKIYSDSAYVINSINNNWIEKWQMNNWRTSRDEPVKNKSLWKIFLKLKGSCLENKINLEFIKVKGHSGNQFNEYVDELAKQEVINCQKGKVK